MCGIKAIQEKQITEYKSKEWLFHKAGCHNFSGKLAPFGPVAACCAGVLRSLIC